MSADELDRQTGTQSDFANQSQNQGQSQGFQPQSDPGVGTEDIDDDGLTDDEGATSETDDVTLIDQPETTGLDGDDEDAPDSDNPNDVGEELPSV